MKKILKVAGKKEVSQHGQQLQRTLDVLQHTSTRALIYGMPTHEVIQEIARLQRLIDAETKEVKTSYKFELKLVQDTRINSNYVRLYVKGHDAPLMDFFVTSEGKLTFRRHGSYRLKQQGVVNETVTDSSGSNTVIAETRDIAAVPSGVFNVPTSGQAFGGDEKTEALQDALGSSHGC